MPSWLLLLVVLACPVGMGLMMLLGMRGMRRRDDAENRIEDKP